MKRKIYPYMAALAMAMASDPYFSLGQSKRMMTEEERKEYEKYQCERNHRLNPVDLSEREFIINGERIMAHDKKTARKIYENRHRK